MEGERRERLRAAWQRNGGAGAGAEDSRWEKDLRVVSQSPVCATAIGELAFVGADGV